MSGDNGKVIPEIELVKVILKEGHMAVTFGKVNITLLSHALRLANLQLDNIIIGSQTQKDQSGIKIVPGINQMPLGQKIIDKIRRGY